MKDITPYELAKIITEIVRYQQNEIDTYKLIMSVMVIVIIILGCECAKLSVL